MYCFCYTLRLLRLLVEFGTACFVEFKTVCLVEIETACLLRIVQPWLVEIVQRVREVRTEKGFGFLAKQRVKHTAFRFVCQEKNNGLAKGPQGVFGC